MTNPRCLPFFTFTILLIMTGTAAAQRAQTHAIYLPSIQANRAVRLELVAPLPNVSSLTAAGGHLYAASLDGLVYRLDPGGQAAPAVVLDIRDRVALDDAEQGLLGLALHPQFAVNGQLYVYYTAVSAAPDAPAVLSRFTVDPGSPAGPATEQPILIIPHTMSLHYGGALHFGPDGYLYVASGDGFAPPPGGWPFLPHAQNGANLLGKILRLDVDTTDGTPYAIPPGNPFLGQDGMRGEIWLLGLRNPWRFSFDRLTGDLYVADVGLMSWEEVNVVPAGVGGLNLGWPCYEGVQAAPEVGSCGPATDYHFPIYTYDHGDGRCAIAGGFVYRGRALPWLAGRYLMADFCSGELWALWSVGDTQQPESLGVYPGRLWTTFGQDEDGELYVAGIGVAAGIYRLAP